MFRRNEVCEYLHTKICVETPVRRTNPRVIWSYSSFPRKALALKLASDDFKS